MKENINSSLRFIDYIVNKVEFYYNPNFEEGPVSIDFNVSKKVVYCDDEQNTMNVTLGCEIFNDRIENNYPFSINVEITGRFELGNCDKSNRTSFAEINSIAILFPYLRSIVSTYTANANVQPLILPPINVVKLFQENA